jgi:DNA modification methylase
MTDGWDSLPKADWEAEGVKLYCGDCLKILPQLPDGCVDAVVTDPPYGIEHASNWDASWAGKKIAGDSNTQVRDTVLSWANGRPWACFGTWKVPQPSNARGVLVWDKGPACGMGDLSFPWKRSWELIAIGGDGWRGTRDEGVLRGPSVVTWESRGRAHPMEKPPWLIVALLKKLPDAHTIIDPTMGVGTTGVACARLGRRFVGIEIEPRYFDIAVRRIDEELSQGKLSFDEGDAMTVRNGMEDVQLELISNE